GGQLAVAGHVPGGGPDERPGEGVGEAGEVVDGGAQRLLVEPDLGVGEVLVVDEHEVGPAGADELGDLGALTVDVRLHPHRALEAGGTVAPDDVVPADDEAVRALDRVLRRDLLGDGEGGYDAVGAGCELG